MTLNDLPVTPPGLFNSVQVSADSPRFMYRHIHRTIAAYVEEKMTGLGWAKRGTNGTVNFGASPLLYQEIQPDENKTPVTPNTVAVTPGDEGEDEVQELGGGLWEVVTPFFFDAYGDDQSISKSIASDIKSLLTRGTVLPLFDWTTGTPTQVGGSYIEFEHVVGPERPPAAQTATDFRRYWSVVKAEAHTYYVPVSPSD